MYRKICITCQRPSFGSDNLGEWICPICGVDLSGERSLPAEDKKECSAESS